MSEHLTEMLRAAGEAHDLLLRWQLVRCRIRHGLTVAAIAERMGWSEDDVIEFESPDADPTLADLRRYAHAAGALIHYDVIAEIIAEPEPEGADHA